MLQNYTFSIIFKLCEEAITHSLLKGELPKKDESGALIEGLVEYSFAAYCPPEKAENSRERRHIKQ